MTNPSELLESLKEIARVSDELPEKYQLKAFELLAAAALRPATPEQQPKTEPETKPKTPESKTPIHLKVRALLTQYELDEGVIDKVFFREGADRTPIYTLKTTNGSKVQIGHALMLCLQEAIESGNFKTSNDTLKAYLKEHKAYSASNYTNNLKNNSDLFKSISDADLELSTDGKAELATLLGELTGDERKGD